MGISLSKGQSINLTKEVRGLKTIQVGLGWDESTHSTRSIDCDASAILLKDSVLESKENLVYFGNKSANGVTHSGDNLTGAGKGDDETIIVNLDEVSSTVNQIDFIVNIYDAALRRQHFGLIDNAYIRILNQADGTELARYNLTEDFDKMRTISAGLLQRNGFEWEFKAIGEGYKEGKINSYIRKYK